MIFDLDPYFRGSVGVEGPPMKLSMGLPAENLVYDELPAPPARLARLVLLPALPRLHTARERLDAAIGPELARFLVAALSEAPRRFSY